MRRARLTAFVLACAASVHAADKIDPRLATVRKAHVIAVDELAIDRPVAACFSEHLNKMTPIEIAKSKDDADVIFRIAAHVADAGERSLARVPGARYRDLHSTADIVAELPDGTKLWSETYLDPKYDTGIECALADDLLTVLRDAMKKARDGQ
jgi:hypothetical protein